MSGSSKDLILISGWKGKLPIPFILISPAACPRDHLSIVMTIRLRQDQSGRAKIVFIATPHKMSAEAKHAAALYCKAQLPRLEAKMSACGSVRRFDKNVEEIQAVIRKPCMVKVKPQPLCYTKECGRKPRVASESGALRFSDRH